MEASATPLGCRDMTSAPSTPPWSSGERRAIWTIAGAQLLVLSLWFSATAVAPSLLRSLDEPVDRSGDLTLAVQVGFVAGALVFGLGTVTDRVDARHMFGASAAFGAIANGMIVISSGGGITGVLILRFFTGVALAGAYPSGLKLVAGWTVTRRGAAMGILIGALTLGSATPHLVGSLGWDWRPVMLTSSALSLLGAGVVLRRVEQGPFAPPRSVFASAQLRVIAAKREIRLATLGYVGHMWELYAFWTWVGAWLAATQAGRDLTSNSVSALVFVIVGSGAAGAVVAGHIADRRSKEFAAGLSLLSSGAVALASPWLFNAGSLLLLGALVFWGVTVVADSAQFSALVADHADLEGRGTALTLQTAIGFAVTLISIRLVGAIGNGPGWQWAFMVLAPGPVIGSWAMYRLAGPGPDRPVHRASSIRAADPS